MSRDKLLTFAFVALALMALELHAQNKTPVPSPKTPETISEDQDSLKNFVNEVRIPITAYDETGHFDPAIELHDLMVKEDGIWQPLKSIYRIPANVLLLLLDTGGELNLAKNVRLTREIAIRLVSSLKKEDQVNVIQVNNRVELVQDWTTEKSDNPLQESTQGASMIILPLAANVRKFQHRTGVIKILPLTLHA